jgi:ribosome maturation protein Sdo1
VPRRTGQLMLEESYVNGRKDGMHTEYDENGKIVDEGEVQLTVEQRRELVEKKRAAIIAFISQQAVDPKTKMPHPPQRIELALEQIKSFHRPIRFC